MSSSCIGRDDGQLVADAPLDVGIELVEVDDARVHEGQALAHDRVEDAVLDEARHLLLEPRGQVADVLDQRACRVDRRWAVLSPGMTSIIGMRCGGFDQCMPTTRSGMLAGPRRSS